LESWTDDPQTESFSGTGLYQTTIEIPKPYLSDPYVLSLDFGKVGQVAEAFVNGESIGVHWMRGQMLDLAGHLHEGPNDLRIEVTNTLINRVSHLTDPSPLPPELEAHYGKRLYEKSGRMSASVGFEPLPASGLLGPVRVVVRKRVELSVD
ncbi:MAG: hypothetical protein KC964_28005, partial [Candidatus Omnitrophica bacterium]|nr:hypothetical protein [Candidatus Omnitrophota bacterium]